MDQLGNEIRKMDFNYFGTGSHVISADAFLAKENTLFLDVRTKEEKENLKLHLNSFCPVLEMTVAEVPDRINEIPKDKLIGVFCSAGIRATIIFTYLKGLGYEHVRILKGGYSPLISALEPGKIYKKLNNIK
ncbi:MAG: rhodanese-like domain-containing protein [Bacteroidales bacterium]